MFQNQKLSIKFEHCCASGCFTFLIADSKTVGSLLNHHGIIPSETFCQSIWSYGGVPLIICCTESDTVCDISTIFINRLPCLLIWSYTYTPCECKNDTHHATRIMFISWNPRNLHCTAIYRCDLYPIYNLPFRRDIFDCCHVRPLPAKLSQYPYLVPFFGTRQYPEVTKHPFPTTSKYISNGALPFHELIGQW